MKTLHHEKNDWIERTNGNLCFVFVERTQHRVGFEVDVNTTAQQGASRSQQLTHLVELGQHETARVVRAVPQPRVDVDELVKLAVVRQRKSMPKQQKIHVDQR